MKITHYLYIGLAALAFTACDKVSTNERFKEQGGLIITPEDTTGQTPGVFRHDARNVLIEEFTAQRCTNCWEGHDELKFLKGKYGKRVVAVSIHCNITNQGIAEIDGYPNTGLMTTDGDFYANNAGITAKLPNSVVNRMSGEQDPRMQVNILEPFVISYANTPSGVNIKLDTELNEDKTKLTISTTLENDADVSGSLQIWLTESDITSMQMGVDDYRNYVHNEVYRASVNGLGGEAVSVKAGEPLKLNHSIDLKSYWKAENMTVVAFVYDQNGVLQATEKELNE